MMSLAGFTSRIATLLLISSSTLTVIADPTTSPPTTVPPSITASSTINAGVLDFTAKPSRCTLSVFPYQTSFDVSSDQMNVEDDNEWWDIVGSNWTFTTDTKGVAFGNPSHPGQNAGDPNDGANPRNSPPTWKRINASSFALEINENTGTASTEYVSATLTAHHSG